ncbi:MAG: hypothetical protein VKN83_05650 [Cyanobacteriota bacterium]|jgi:hypothetical protein|nr:hypothetical protein [Cyanobacteriota bacterium]
MDRSPSHGGGRALVQGRRLRSIQLVSLLFTTGTLVCCVLPATLVLIGAGSVMASLVSTVPALVVLSQHKAPVFTLAGVGLLLAGLALWRQATRGSCPTDPEPRRACLQLQRQARLLFGISLLGYGAALVVTFLLPLLV